MFQSVLPYLTHNNVMCKWMYKHMYRHVLSKRLGTMHAVCVNWTNLQCCVQINVHVLFAVCVTLTNLWCSVWTNVHAPTCISKMSWDDAHMLYVVCASCTRLWCCVQWNAVVSKGVWCNSLYCCPTSTGHFTGGQRSYPSDTWAVEIPSDTWAVKKSLFPVSN